MKARLIPVFTLFITLTVTLSAQTFRGTILGSVTDAQGAVVAGAKVTAKNVGTGLERTTGTSTDGTYSLPELPIGAYTVTVTQAGFRTSVAKEVIVDVSAEVRVDLRLTPGQVSQRVEVNADVPLIETAGDTLGGVIEGAQATEIPLNGRDFTKLLIMVPGATSDPSVVSDFAGSFGTFSINGSRGRSNNYLLDGTDMNDGFRNDPAINEGGVFGVPATLLPVDAVAEFGVLAGTEAEYGRNSGAIINTVTKSGTNSLHGTAFEDFRNDNLDARNYFNAKPQTQDIFQNNQFGGSVGGPIVRDHTFFYGAYEGQRERVATPSIVTVPTQAQLVHDAPVTGINSVIQGILDRNPWGPLPAGTTGVDAPATVQTTVRATNRLDSAIAKIDQHIGRNDVLTGRYFFGDSDQSFPLTLVFGSNLPGFNTVVPTRVQLISLSYTHIISPKLLVEVRGGWNRFAEGFAPQDVNFNPNSIGLATVPSNDPTLFGLPQILIAGGISSIGASGSIPRHRVDTNWQYFTNFSYTAGKHNWKTGFEFRRTAVNGFLDGNFRGKLSFASFSDFLAGDFTGGGGGSQASGDTHRLTHQNNYGLYLQDGFRPTHKLTINYGLRWDYYGVIGEKHDRFSIFNLSTELVQLVGTSGLSKLYPSDHKDFSPRGSVAYDLFGTGRTVLRAGYELAYDSFSQDYFLDQSVNNGGNLGPAYNAIGPSPVGSSGLTIITQASGLVPGQPVFGTFSSTNPALSPIFSVSQSLRTPYTQNYNFNVEQQLGGAAALQVGYAGALGRRLFAFGDINQFNPSLGAQPYAAAGFTGIINQFASDAVSNYNSLQSTLNFHSYHGFTAALNYTWAHSIDTASDGFDAVPGTTQPDNSYDRARERADSNFDSRQRFSSNFHYEIPGGSSMKRLTSGWSVDGVVSLQTGQPFDVITFASGNFNQSGEGFSRPDLVGDPFAGTSTPNSYLNLSAFAVPCTWDPAAGACVNGTQHFGSLGRNAFHGPHFRNFDFTLAKTTPLFGERVKLQLRADFFNIFNHVNFSNPVLPNYYVDYLPSGAPAANGQGFGFLPITATPDVGSSNPYLGGGGPRNIQIGARFIF